MQFQFSKKEIGRFLIGGGSAVAIDYIFYRLLMLLGWGRAAAKAVSFICGSIVGFIINKYWTFESSRFSKKEVLCYIFLYACTALINAGVNSVVMSIFHFEIFSFLCATGISTILNFFGQKFFVFNKKEKESV